VTAKLETDRYPEILFVTERVEVPDKSQSPTLMNLDGNITLHGQTRTQMIQAKVSVNHGFLRAFGEFAIFQSDFNIRMVSIGGGTLKKPRISSLLGCDPAGSRPHF
jgi:polyisoprenoid-binding protein YceI